RRPGYRGRDAPTQVDGTRIELSAQRRADQGITHRLGTRLGIAFEASDEQGALFGRELVVDESRNLIVDLFCHGKALLMNATTTVKWLCRSPRVHGRCASARSRRDTPWSARSPRS